MTINYWNLYRKREDEFGPGYPRPIVFVNDDFDESVIDKESREYEYYTYYLIKVKEDSKQQKFLQIAKSMKKEMLSIPPDNYGVGVARMHYKLLEIYASL